MHAHHSHARRRKRRPLHGVKSVDVTRGKTGYGFTISGQHPCVLSCIVSGSAAERAGLKPGDYLVSVNGENVSKAPHDDVVRMIGTSTGTLTLQVAENYNSSDSSDDDYHIRPKSRYPNRVRPRHLIGMSPEAKVLKEQSQNTRIPPSSQESKAKSSHNRFSNQHRKPHPLASSSSRGRSHSPSDGLVHVETKWGRLSSSSASRLHDTSKAGNVRAYVNTKSHSSSSLKPSEERIHGGGSGNIRPGVYPGGPASTPINRLPRPHSQPELNHSRVIVTPIVEHEDSFPQEFPPVLSRESLNRTTAPNDAAMHLANQDEEEMDHDGLVDNRLDNFDVKAIVGYVGTIEMPSYDNRMQNIRNAMRRLRIEQKIHTLILMEVLEASVKLTNAIGNVMAEYPAEKLAFSGVCPDDKRFFGLVTLSSSSACGDASSGTGPQDDCASSGSCHVFMVDPELQSHNIHAQKAAAFNIQCTMDPETQNCLEFPRSATPIVTSVSRLYRDRPGGIDLDVIRSQIFAEPVVAPQRHHSSSSNSHDSDSGLGFSKDDNQLNERVYIVDVPAGFARHDPRRWSQRDSLTGSAPDLHHLSPDVSTMPTPHHHHFQRPSTQRMSSRRLLNSSVSSEDSLQRLVTDRLNIRAMPDPSNLWKSHSSNALELHHSADSMRRSMHKYLQARQRHIRDAPGTSSDQESQTSMCFRAENMSRSASHSSIQQRPASAPFQQLTQGLSVIENKAIAVVLKDKLSPRAFLPVGPTLRSPSAPPLTTYREDGEEEDDLDITSDSDEDFDDDDSTVSMDHKLARFDRDQTAKLQLDGEPRRFSEGFILAKKREKEKGIQAEIQRWTKTGSLRRPKTAKKVLSQSHESLIVTDGVLSGAQKLVSAGSVNSISQHGGKKSHEADVGRVAGWAVNFGKLLNDPAGISVFTDFLKKEFSEENILFWKICVEYKKIGNPEQRKRKAKEIYDKHVSSKALEPVNIDSRARQHCEGHLELSSPEMFDIAQQQIFQLMKQDSYSRFLRSDLYKSCLMAEIEGKPLDFLVVEDDAVPELREKDKKIKKAGEPEVKRRKSLLPWVKNKASKQSTKSKKNKENNQKEESVNANTNNQKKAAFVSVDLSLMRKEVAHTTEIHNMETREDEEEAQKGNFKFCRVILPDGSTTVVCAKPGQTIRVVLGRLCEKRSLSVAAVDVFLLGSDKALDLGNDISSLGSKEIIIERRVLFRMDLPNRKSIGVKAKPNRSIRDVFKPILHKYGYKIDHVAIQLSGHAGTVDIDCPTSSVDNQRVVVIPKEDIVEWSGNDGRRLTHGRPPVPARAKTVTADCPAPGQHGSAALDEITNQVFEDLMQGKSELAHNFDELGILDPDRTTKVTKNGDEHRLSGLFGLLRRESLGAKDSGKPKIKNKVTFAVQKSESRKRGKGHDDNNFLELLSKMQSQRIDDQRGLGRESLEVPSFLLKGSDGPESTSHNPPAVHQTSQPTDEYNIGDFDEIDPRLMGLGRQCENKTTGRPSAVNQIDSDGRSIRSFKTFGSPTEKMAYTNNSFSQEFVIPSYDQALMYFDAFSHPSNPDFDDPMLMVRSLSDIGLDNAFSELTTELHQTRPPEFSRRSAFQPTCKKPERAEQFQTSFVVPKASPEKFSPNSTDHEQLSPTGSDGLLDYSDPIQQRYDTCESEVMTMPRAVAPPVIKGSRSTDTCNNNPKPVNLQPFRNFSKAFGNISPECSDSRLVQQRSSRPDVLNEPISSSDCDVPFNENTQHPSSGKSQTSKTKRMVRVNGTSNMVHNNNTKPYMPDTTFLKPRTPKPIGSLEHRRSRTRRPVYSNSLETEGTADNQVTFV